MTLKTNINVIKEIYPGQYQIILDFATNGIIKYLLNNAYKYVYVSNYNINNSSSWQLMNLPFSDGQNLNMLARNLSYDFAMPTSEFREQLHLIIPGISMIQLNNLPKTYLSSAIKGKTRYELLKNECDFLFELEIPSATDYGTLISCDKNWLQSVLDNKEIDWTNLP